MREEIVMADSPTLPGQPRWLLTPPETGKIQIVISQGPGVKLSAELQKSLDALIRQLGDAETRALLQDKCSPVVLCNPLSCSGVTICNLATTGGGGTTTA
jgi:hypothetical protein